MVSISRRRVVVGAVLAVTIVLSLSAAQAPLQKEERVDLAAIGRIRQEGLQRSQVMEIASYLTDVFGPRLTNSPSAKDAAAWTEQTMKQWGVSNVHLERWPFGRGWQNVRFVAAATSPQPFPLIGFPKAWTPGTNGPVTASAVLAIIKEERDFDTFRGKLQGTFVLEAPPLEVRAGFEPLGRRLTDADLSALMGQPTRGRGGNRTANNSERQALERKKRQFWIDEGVAAVIGPSGGDGGTFFVQDGGSRDPKAPLAASQIVLAVEHYGRIARLLERRIPVTLTMDIDNRFFDADLDSFNIIGDLPGTDLPDEVVLIGAHFDSWHSGTGATDNAAGCAVMLEAMRILKTTGVGLRRTVRIGLWTGEEQGYLGSRAYVKAHLGDAATKQFLPGHAKFSGYFNLDNGTGQIRGVYLQGNAAVAPIFSKWEEPLNDLGMTMVTMRGTGGTDHVPFDAIGVPAFQFVQDPIEYDSRTHHSNMDVYERLQGNDLMRNAVIVATFAYQAANREEKLPRK